jgi:DNA-binding NarL/FixJ family response regulator
MRAGLRALLAGEDVEVAGAAATLPAAPDADVVLLAEAELLGVNGRAALERARMGVVLLADAGRAAGLLRELPPAGWGVLSPDAAPEELRAAVRAAAEGLVVLTPALAGQLLNRRPPAAQLADGTSESLTPRELEVLERISQGLSNKLIARDLGISEHTVKFHVSSVFAKLGASSRTDAINRAARQGLITL